MATSLASHARYLKECPVCLEDMLQLNRKPKLLECFHSCCMPCLSKLAVAQRGAAIKITCPKCNHNTIVQSGTLSNLPDHYLLYQFKATLDHHMRHDYCFFCRKKDVEQRAVSLCVTCNSYMCDNCQKKHKKVPKFQNHEIFFVVKDKKKMYENCPKHNEPVWYVCLRCAPARHLCNVCLTLDEACHHGELVDYLEYMTALAHEKSKLKNQLDQQNDIEDKFLEYNAQLQRDVERICENIKSTKQSLGALRAAAALQLEKSSNIKALSLAAHNSRQSRNRGMELLRSDNKEIRDIQEVLQEIRGSSGKYDDEAKKMKFINLSPSFEDKVKEEFSKFTQTFMRMLRPRPSLLSSTRVVGNIGKLRASREGRVLYVRHGGIYITELWPNRKCLNLETDHTTEYGCDIAVDVFDNHMYFTSKVSTGIKRTIKLRKSEIPSAYRTWMPLYERTFWYISDICVCNEGSIILAWPNGKLHRYNRPHGVLTCHNIPYQDRHIQLTSVKLDRQLRFIATYATHKAVILYDTDGKELQIISKYGSPIKQPRATTINDQGNILVVDSEECKIVELTMNGEHIHDVLTKDDGLKHPVNIAYSHPYLWVADEVASGTSCLKCFK